MLAVLGVLAATFAVQLAILPLSIQDFKFCWIAFWSLNWSILATRCDFLVDPSLLGLRAALTRGERFVGDFLKASILLGASNP